MATTVHWPEQMWVVVVVVLNQSTICHSDSTIRTINTHQFRFNIQCGPHSNVQIQQSNKYHSSRQYRTWFMNLCVSFSFKYPILAKKCVISKESNQSLFTCKFGTKGVHMYKKYKIQLKIFTVLYLNISILWPWWMASLESWNQDNSYMGCEQITHSK